MRKLIAVFAIGLLFAGCVKNNPVDSGDGAIQSEAMFSELSMINTALAVGIPSGVLADTGGGCVHDSLRNVHMLDSIKVYLSLTDEQVASLQTIGATLFAKLEEIRGFVQAGTITRDSSKTLVALARAEFITSVKLILTAEQSALFDTWITLYWDKPRHGGGHGGHGHGGGHGHHGGGH